MKKIRKMIPWLALALFITACESNVEEDDMMVEGCETEISYASVISPLIDSKCMPCHNGDGSNPTAPDLTTYNLVKAAAGRIRAATQSGAMPQGGSLTQGQKDAIKCWVDAGALNN